MDTNTDNDSYAAVWRGLDSICSVEEMAMLAGYGKHGDLRGVIEALRLLMVRNLREDNRAAAVTTASALIRAEVAYDRLAEAAPNEIELAINEVLGEMNVGGPRPSWWRDE
jgi:hypothetical protein